MDWRTKLLDPTPRARQDYQSLATPVYRGSTVVFHDQNAVTDDWRHLKTPMGECPGSPGKKEFLVRGAARAQRGARWGTQVGSKIVTKIDVNFEKLLFEKLCFSFSGKTKILVVLEVQVGSQNRSKSNSKRKSRREAILASICYRFGWIWEAMLGQQAGSIRSQVR